ncbi:MAG TPA: serine hydrolase [Candidatus Magasanikbacteria bacterium]|nr:serine hydrolase [Candidatus Magasanikbacteria bacterium]
MLIIKIPMQLYKKALFGFVSLILTLPSSLSAATFDPNYLLSDEEMQNWQSMNREDIQAFLTDKGSYIANLTTPDKDGIERPASDIIYQAAVDNRINPKYVLVKLQKEQSLISEDNPTQKQLDWATGYGVCDSCSMSDPDIQKHKGFGTQVDSAAGIMRWYYDNVNSQGWIKRAMTTYTIDDAIVTPANYATAFLYTYTPHLQGNLNFWKLWQEWFDQVYPDGSLIKTADAPDVYLIQDGEKRRFTSMSALATRFDPKLILTVPVSELSRYAEGKNISLPNYSIAFDGSTYYLLDYDFKRPFASAETLKQIGYNPDEIINVSSSDLDPYILGKMIEGTGATTPLGRIIEIKESKNVYFVDEGLMHPIFDPAILKTNFSHLQLEKLSTDQVGTLGATFGPPVILKDGTVFGIKGFNEVYVVEKGKKRHIASEDVFNGLGFNPKNIVWVNEYVGMAHETGEPIYLKPSTSTSSNSTQTTVNTLPPTTQTPTTETKKPVDYMVRTPADHVSFIGTTFETPIDSYIVADTDGTILAGKNIDTVRPLASLTKLMTAHVLIDQQLPLTDSTTYTASKHKSAYHNFAVAEGDTLQNKDILYSMLIGSNNTASVMLADSLGYTVQSFAKLMNIEAQRLGLTDMYFTDSYGYDPANVGTGKEVLTLFREAIKSDTIATALGTGRYSYDELTSSDATVRHTEIHSNTLLKRDLPYTILASKTGFLYESGSCLIMLVERNQDGKKFILLTMGNPDFGLESRFDEPNRFASWALKNF